MSFTEESNQNSTPTDYAYQVLQKLLHEHLKLTGGELMKQPDQKWDHRSKYHIQKTSGVPTQEYLIVKQNLRAHGGLVVIADLNYLNIN
uniref:Uncharacterized protein n=1 Tax=Psilocybe cubensis TaxID=181762 RepID=A0A8H7XQZ7_PSICU